MARVLIESLDDQPDLDSVWLDEALRRAVELQAGMVKSVAAATSFANARRHLAG